MLWEWLLCCASAAVLDVMWALYTKHCAAGRRFVPAMCAAALMAFTGYVTMQYTQQPWLLSAAVVGAFVGTWLGLK